MIATKSLSLLLCLLSWFTPIYAQQKFQIATIKPSAANTAKHTQIQGNRFATTGTTVEDLLKFAYNIHVSQIVGGPSWVRTEQFDIMADPEMERRPSLPEVKAMTADLLTERFHLVLARGKAELPVFALVRNKTAFRLKAVTPDPSSVLSGGLVAPGSLYVHGATVDEFVAYLQRFAPPEIDRPIVNQTEIRGRFEFELHFTPVAMENEQYGSSPTAGGTPSPYIFTAIQDQLGLKLIATKAEIENLTIVSITAPTGN